MLQKFGEHIRGWFAGIVIAVIAIAFVAWGLEYYIDRDHGSSAAVATVNGEKITETMFNQRVAQVQRQQEKAMGRGLSEQELKALKQMTLNQMISQTVISQAVKKDGFSVGLDEVKQYVEQMPQFQANGQFSPQLLQNALYNMGYTSPDQFYELLREDQMIRQLANGVRGSSFVMPYELKTFYSLWKERRDFRFTLLPINKLELHVHPTDAEIMAYYKSHQNDFMTPASVQLQYILLSRDTLQKKVTVTAAAVRDYYESNKANFTVPASWKITRITVPTKKAVSIIEAKIKAGQKLTALAQHPQKDWQAVTQTISAADVAPSLVDVFNGLSIGEVSKPLPTPGGYTIFELLAKTPQHARPFASVEKQIKQMLISQQVDQEASQKSEQLSTVVFTNPTSLEPAAQQTGLTIQTSPMLTQQGAKSGVFAEKQVMDAAFSDSVFKQGNNSNPISLKNGGVMVLRVVKSVPAREKPLAEVKLTIVNALKKQTALRQAGVQAYTLQSQLQKGQSLSSLDWQTRKQASRQDPSVKPEILKAAFTTSLKQYQSVELKDGYAIVEVTAIEPADWSKATAKEQEGLAVNLGNMRGSMEFQIYVQNLLKTAKVDIKDKNLADSWRM